MRRALFAREFRSALVPNLVTAGAILATLVVLEHLYSLRLGKAEDIRHFTDFALLIGLVLSGFISGERCFPSELKESRIFFLSSLPISRSWVWLLIVSARLLAAVASLVLTVALRRPQLAPTDSGNLLRLDIGLVIAALVLSAYVLFFSTGGLFALLFRRTLFSYVAGFLVLGLLLIETLFSISYSMAPTHPGVLSIIPMFFLGDAPPPPRTAAFLSALMVLSVLLSWRFFIRGEIANPKRRIRNQLLFGIAATAYLGFVFCVESSPKLTSIGGTWKEIDDYFVLRGGTSHGVSPDGRYLFVLESLDRRPFIARVSIVDTRTGRTTGQSIRRGIYRAYWSGSDRGDVLNLAVLNNSPLDRWGYLIPGTVDWIRLSPEAQEISKLRLREVQAVAILAGGRAVAVLQEGDQGRVNLLDGASGRSSEMMRAPLDGEVVARGDGQAALIYFKNVLLPRRAWVIDSLVHEVRVPQSRPQTASVVFGEFSESPAEAQAALLRRFAPPSTTPGGTPIRGRFLLPDQDEIWSFFAGPNVKGLYFMEEREPEGRIWARSTSKSGRWEKLPDMAPHLLRFFETSTRSAEHFIDFTSGIGAFLSADGDARRFFVYDPQLGATLEQGSCAPGSRTFLIVNRVPGLRGALIALTCMDNSSPRRSALYLSSGYVVSTPGQTHYFEHLSGSREVREIKTGPARLSLSPLYFDERGSEVWTTNSEIWRSAPGRRDLRLWPARQNPSP
jgi:hypothetical protein